MWDGWYFWVVSNNRQSEMYLLEEWGSDDKEFVADREEKLKTGVPDEAGIIQPPCLYDMDNLCWSGWMIVDLLLIDLWNKLKKEMSYDILGPMAFTMVIEHQEQLNDSTVCILVDKLKVLCLKGEPA